MSFDQDPNEQANISGADLAIMIDELKASKAREADLLQQLADYKTACEQKQEALYGADAEIAELQHESECQRVAIMELRQRNMVLVAGLRKLADMQIVEQFEIIGPLLAETKTASSVASPETDLDEALRRQ